MLPRLCFMTANVVDQRTTASSRSSSDLRVDLPRRRVHQAFSTAGWRRSRTQAAPMLVRTPAMMKLAR